MSYSNERTAESMGIEVGSVVIVTGWKNSGVGQDEPPSWGNAMDDTIGKTYKVARINESYSIRLVDMETGEYMWNYNPAWIRLVNNYETIGIRLLTM